MGIYYNKFAATLTFAHQAAVLMTMFRLMMLMMMMMVVVVMMMMMRKDREDQDVEHVCFSLIGIP